MLFWKITKQTLLAMHMDASPPLLGTALLLHTITGSSSTAWVMSLLAGDWSHAAHCVLISIWMRHMHTLMPLLKRWTMQHQQILITWWAAAANAVQYMHTWSKTAL